ncbi:MAG: ribonuclease HI [Spirochaetales bacterium]
MKAVKLYTDGACSGNPGPGGWAAILIYNGAEKIVAGYEDETTNNRMELLAVIRGLQELKEACAVTVYTDSAYVHNAFKEDWIGFWRTNNWHTKGKKDVANKDLWQLLLTVMEGNDVKWVKVKGHSDNEYNNKCDKFAVDEIKKHQKKEGI